MIENNFEQIMRRRVLLMSFSLWEWILRNVDDSDFFQQIIQTLVYNEFLSLQESYSLTNTASYQQRSHKEGRIKEPWKFPIFQSHHFHDYFSFFNQFLRIIVNEKERRVSINIFYRPLSHTLKGVVTIQWL